MYDSFEIVSVYGLNSYQTFLFSKNISGVKPPKLAHWLRHSNCSTVSFAGSSLTWGGRRVADARDQQPFEPGEWGPRVR